MSWIIAEVLSIDYHMRFPILQRDLMKTVGLVKWFIDFIEAEAALNFQCNKMNKSSNCSTLKDVFNYQNSITFINVILFQM